MRHAATGHKLARMPEQPLTTPQAAARYDVPERTLQRAIKTGELPAERLDVRGGTYQVQPADAEKFAKDWRARKAARREGTATGEREVRNT